MWPENETYIGPPTDELDDAWFRLWNPFGFSISEEEAKAAFGDKYVDYYDGFDGGYTAGYDLLNLLGHLP